MAVLTWRAGRYIVNRGTALYAGRPRHEGAAWGEDVLLNRPSLQLDFEALAATCTPLALGFPFLHLAKDALPYNQSVQ